MAEGVHGLAGSSNLRHRTAHQSGSADSGPAVARRHSGAVGQEAVGPAALPKRPKRDVEKLSEDMQGRNVTAHSVAGVSRVLQAANAAVSLVGGESIPSWVARSAQALIGLGAGHDAVTNNVSLAAGKVAVREDAAWAASQSTTAGDAGQTAETGKAEQPATSLVQTLGARAKFLRGNASQYVVSAGNLAAAMRPDLKVAQRMGFAAEIAQMANGATHIVEGLGEVSKGTAKGLTDGALRVTAGVAILGGGLAAKVGGSETTRTWGEAVANAGGAYANGVAAKVSPTALFEAGGQALGAVADGARGAGSSVMGVGRSAVGAASTVGEATLSSLRSYLPMSGRERRPPDDEESSIGMTPMRRPEQADVPRQPTPANSDALAERATADDGPAAGSGVATTASAPGRPTPAAGSQQAPEAAERPTDTAQAGRGSGVKQATVSARLNDLD